MYYNSKHSNTGDFMSQSDTWSINKQTNKQKAITAVRSLQWCNYETYKSIILPVHVCSESMSKSHWAVSLSYAQQWQRYKEKD